MGSVIHRQERKKKKLVLLIAVLIVWFVWNESESKSINYVGIVAIFNFEEHKFLF